MSGQPEPVTTTLRITQDDCDGQGNVSTAGWYALFSTATEEFWREVIGGYHHLPQSLGVRTITAETGARFRGAARPGDVVDVTVIAVRVGSSSLRIELVASREGQPLAESFAEHVFVQPQSFEPAEMPEQLRRMLVDDEDAADREDHESSLNDNGAG